MPAKTEVANGSAIRITSLILTVNDLEVPLDENNQAVFLPGEAGTYIARAVATDMAGHTGEGVADFYAVLGGDVTPPEVAFTSPDQDAELKTPTDIIGTASDDNLYKYTLSYRLVGETEFITFATGYESVTDDVLGTLDTSLMVNGIYEVQLRAEDTSGNVREAIRRFLVTGNLKIGNFTISFNDLSIPVVGIPITVTRTYDSRDKTVGDFGVGWTLSLSSGIKLQENTTLGANWRSTDTTYPLAYGVVGHLYALQPIGRRTVSVTWPDGRTESFRAVANPSQQHYIPLTWINGVDFVPIAPATSSLIITDGGPNYYYGDLDGLGSLIRVDDGIPTGVAAPYDPTSYLLTTADGKQYTFTGDWNNRTAQLTSITDRNGNTIQFTEDGIIHSAGKSVTYARDDEGRIISITDPSSDQILFEYDDRGDLVAVTNQDGNTAAFEYNSHHDVTEIIDPHGLTPVRNIYDDNGRLIAVIDAQGNRTDLSHDLDTRQEVVTDRLGHITVYECDQDGNVLTQIEAVGTSLARTTEHTYDADGNKLTMTDPLGKTTTWTYDQRGNALSETDALGYQRFWAYDAHNLLLSKTDALGNTTTYEYDANGDPIRKTGPLGNTTTFTHDDRGQRVSEVRGPGNVTTWQYDSHGDAISETDPLGNVTIFGYDANGNRLSQTQTRTTESGTVAMTVQWQYDAHGQVTQTVDALTNVEVTEYYGIGLPSATVDMNGNRVEHEYGATGSNLTRTVYSDGSEVRNTYDAEDNLTSSVDRDGNTIIHEYDLLGRLVHSMLPDGSDVFYEYDALDRKTRTVMPDGSAATIAYGCTCSDQRTAETDQDGRTTHFEYDPFGRLTKVIDAIGGLTSFRYDEVGNRTSQIDAEGRVTYMEYDDLGRVTKRILPLGQEEIFTYDPNGNVITHTDCNGGMTTFEYDGDSRLIRKSLPDGTSVVYTRTGGGLRAQAGGDAYTYSPRRQLLTETKASGDVLTYTYDNAGNRTSVTTSEGTTIYTFDTLNRLETVTDPDSGVTAYTYDAVGNRASITYPNATVAEYTYDSLNRLTLLVNRKSSGETISSYTYTLGLAGNRTRVVEHTGRTVDYDYDGLYRLIGETVTNDPDGINVATFYTYDGVGNRLHQTTITDTTVVTTFYTYDDNDRLITERRTESIVGGQGTATGTRYASAHAGYPRPSASAPQLLGMFLALTLSAFVTPLIPFGAGRRSAGRRVRRRRMLIRTVVLVVLPVMSIGPENVEALNVETQLYDAVAGGALGGTVESITIAFAYDANGNMASRSDGTETDTYTYDSENRLVTADIYLGSTPGLVSYTYDADGVRNSKTTTNGTTQFLVDKNRRYAQVLIEQSNTEMVEYIYGDDLISMTRAGTATSYYHYDGHLSTRQLTGGGGDCYGLVHVRCVRQPTEC